MGSVHGNHAHGGAFVGRLLGVAALSMALLDGCSMLSGSMPKQQVIETTEFAPSLGIDLSQMKKDSYGVYYQDVVVGTGPAVQSTDTISIGYTGWLSDDTEFSSADSVAFPLGMGAVIPGLEDGITGELVDPMHVGGERKLVIPPGMGYGDQGYGPVPGGKILVFDVTLKGIGGVTPP